MKNNVNNSLSKDLRVFGNVRALCTAAFLAAVCVVIAYICKSFTITPSIRITFENLPLIFAGYVLGPWVGLLTGICADITSTAASSFGIAGINPLLTVGSASIGFLSGIISHYIIPKKSVLQVIATVYIPHIIGNMVIKTIALYQFYATSPFEIALRVVIYTVIAGIETSILIILLRSKGITKALGALRL